jgi:hypothetical protein
MQFILDNQRWFLLISCIALLALIGYAAERRNNREKNRDGREEDGDDSSTDEIEIEDNIPAPEPKAAVELATQVTEKPAEEDKLFADMDTGLVINDEISFETNNDVPALNSSTDSETLAEKKAASDDFGLGELPSLRVGEQNTETEKEDVWKF